MNDFLLLGGAGTTGRRVARRLRAAGLSVRVTSRTHGDVRLDLDDPSTWSAALDGVGAAYLIEPDLGQRRLSRLVDAAALAGVRRLVLLSAPGVENNQAHPLWPVEEAVKGSGVEWTIVRPNWFAQNFSETFWSPGIRAGVLALPTGDGATAFVDAEDIADVVAAALTQEGHDGQTYELTGPRALTFGEACDLIGRAADRTIRHVDLSPEAFIQAQLAHGVPAEAAKQLAGIYTSIRDGLAATVFDGVQRALGRLPRSFEDFVAAAWGAPDRAARTRRTFHRSSPRP